jgi:hypothetical protein
MVQLLIRIVWHKGVAKGELQTTGANSINRRTKFSSIFVFPHLLQLAMNKILINYG